MPPPDTAGQAGFDLDLLRGFDLATLHILVSPTGEVDPTRCWLMAEILYLDGLETLLSDGDGQDSLLKARGLYDMIRPAGSMGYAADAGAKVRLRRHCY